jgi:hypothetical protein
MAKVKFSALVSDMRNKLNGSVFSKNRAGSYLRNKVTPVNPQTAAQVAVRNNFTTLSQNWRGLTDAQRLSFASAVDTFKRTDIFGDLKTPSPLNLYMRLNGNLQIVGVAPMSVAPVSGDTPQLTALSAVGDISLTSIEIDTDEAAVPANTAYVVDATPPVSAGVTFVKSQFRTIQVLDAAESIPANVWASYVAKFGTPIAGQKIFIRLIAIDKTTGLRSQALGTSIVFVA